MHDVFAQIGCEFGDEVLRLTYWGRHGSLAVLHEYPNKNWGFFILTRQVHLHRPHHLRQHRELTFSFLSLQWP